MPRKTLNLNQIQQGLDDDPAESPVFATRSRTRDTQSRRSTNKRQSTAPDSPSKRKPTDSTQLESGSRLRNTPGRACRAASHDSSSTKENESTNTLSRRKSIAPVESSRNTPSRRCRAGNQDTIDTPSKELAKITKNLSINTPKKTVAEPSTPHSSRKSSRQSTATYENKFVPKPTNTPQKLEGPPSRRNNPRSGRYSPSAQLAREKQNFGFSDDSDFESPKKRQTPRRQTNQKAEKSTPAKAVTPRRLKFQTPKKTPRKLLQNLTPSMRERSNQIVKPSTLLQEARNRLHVSAVPKSLPCREEEFNNIFMFLRSKLLDGTGGYSLYYCFNLFR